MSRREHRPKCECGRELRSKQEQALGECRRCQEFDRMDDDDETELDEHDLFSPDLEMRT